MQDHLKAIRTESKGKSASKVATATDELQYLMDLNTSITQAVAKTMEHLTDFVFVSVGNLTLARRDSYLLHVKTGVKPDTLAVLRTAPLHLGTLFTDNILKQAEEDIANYESKGHSSCGMAQHHQYERLDRKSDKRTNKPTWKNIGSKGQSKKSKSQGPAVIQMTITV